MSSAPLESLHDLLRQALQAAEVLGDTAALQMAQVIGEYGGAAKLQILILGTTGAGRSSVVNAMLAHPGLLPASAVPKAPLDLQVRYGSSEMAEAVRHGGGREVLPVAKVRQVLTSPSDAVHYDLVDLRAPIEALKTCDLRVIALEAERTPEAWRRLLAADYVILILRAPALLSQAERDVVRQYLVDYGLQRVAIVINQMDLIADEERDSLMELVQIFLGPFERQPVLLPLSAAEVPSPGSGYPALAMLVTDLIERYPTIREEALTRALEALVAELDAGVARQQAIASLDEREIEQLRLTIDSRRDWLEGRVKRAQGRIDSLVATVIKERLLREIEDFGEVFRRRLPDEVVPVENIAAIKRYLPGYIQATWAEFLRRQTIAVSDRLLQEVRAIGLMVETDLEGLLGNRSTDLREHIRGFHPDEAALRTFVLPRRGQHRAMGVAKGLSVQGYLMLLVNPAAGILSLAGSHAIRRFFRGDIALADKRAILAAATDASRELEGELRRQIEEAFTALTAELKKDIANAYTEGVAGIAEFLADSAARQDDVDERRAVLAVLRNRTIPDVRRRLQALTEEPTQGVMV